MHIRCPHCHNPVEIIEESSFREIPCPTCGSSFSLVGEGESTHTLRTTRRKLAHFELFENLGVGQFGSVWKAKDTELDRFVAIKIPRREQLSEQDVDYFLREARAAAQLKHPNIVSVHEVGRDEKGTVFIASELVQGANLKSWLKNQPLPPNEAARLCMEIASAVHHAHEAGVIHRDLKPSNIMMDLDGSPHIMDFGMAKRDSGEITMTADGAILGTPAYMSPEQARGEGHTVDRRADVYSLGVILFELLTGELPFRGDKRMLIVQILTEEPPSPRRLNSKVSRDLATICTKCLQKSPDNRYLSAKLLVEDLGRFLTNRPIRARPVSRFARLCRYARRKPAESGLTVAALVAVVAIGVALSVSTYNAELQRLYELARAERTRAEDARQAADAARERGLLDRKRAEDAMQRALLAQQQAEASASDALEANQKLESLFYLQAVAAVDSLLDSSDQNLPLLFDEDSSSEERDSRRTLIKSSVDRARALLNDCPSNPRYWEWNYLSRRLVDIDSNFLHPDSGSYESLALTKVVCEEATYRGGVGPLHGIALSPDGRRIAVASRDGVTTWQFSDGELLRELNDLNSFSGAIQFSPDGTRLAFGESEARVHLVNLNSNASQMLESFGLIAAYDLAWSPNGQLIAVAYFGKTALIWDANTGGIRHRLADHDDYVMCVEFDPTGEKLATGSSDGLVRIWDVRTGEQLSSFGYRRISTVESLKFLPDGRRLVAGGRDQLGIWDIVSGDELAQLSIHKEVVTCVTVSPDGKRIASGGTDQAVRVWDAESGQLLVTLDNHKAPLTDLSFTSDGQSLASIDLSGKLIVWNGKSP